MKDLYTKDFPRLKVAIRDGSNYALSHRLTYYASNFAPATPLNQAVTLGFYDTPDTEIRVASVPSSLHTVIHVRSLRLIPFRQINRPHFAAPCQGVHRLHQSQGQRRMDTDNCADEVRASGSPRPVKGPIHEKGGSVLWRR